MAYATRADLRLSDALLTWLTGELAGLTVPDEDAIAAVLEQASKGVDRRIGQRYSLPWEDTEGQLREYTVALARLALYEMRPDGPDIPKSIMDAAAAARRELAEIAGGDLSLSGQSLVPDAAPQEPTKLKVRGPERTFDRDTLRRW